jgi:hypothetical protein
MANGGPPTVAELVVTRSDGPWPWPWPWPPASAGSVRMTAVRPLLAPDGSRVIAAGEGFDTPADRAALYVVTEMAAVAELPCWWPPAAPSHPGDLWAVTPLCDDGPTPD